MDQTKYINAYIDVAMSTIHESTAQLLQQKTQNRVANDLLAEKDNIIATLTTEVENLKNGISDLSNIRSQNENMMQQHVGLTNKLAHFETLTNQVIQMKNEILLKDQIIQKLQDQIAAINKRKSKVKPAIVAGQPLEKKVEIDDF